MQAQRAWGRRGNTRPGRALCQSMVRSGGPDRGDGDRPPPCRGCRPSRVRRAMDRSTGRECGDSANATAIPESRSAAGSAAIARAALGSAAETGTDPDTAPAGRMIVPVIIPPGGSAGSALPTTKPSRSESRAGHRPAARCRSWRSGRSRGISQPLGAKAPDRAVALVDLTGAVHVRPAVANRSGRCRSTGCRNHDRRRSP